MHEADYARTGYPRFCEPSSALALLQTIEYAGKALRARGWYLEYPVRILFLGRERQRGVRRRWPTNLVNACEAEFQNVYSRLAQLIARLDSRAGAPLCDRQ